MPDDPVHGSPEEAHHGPPDKNQEWQRLLDAYQAGVISKEELARRREHLQAAQPPAAGGRDDKVAIFRRYVELQNARDYAAMEQLFAPQYINHTWFGHHPIRPQAHTRALRGWFKAFPDANLAVNEIIAVEGDWVVGRTTARGTQVGEIFGNRPTGEQQIATSLIHCIRVVDGRIAEYRSTNPFEDQFDQSITRPDDVQETRAQQGIDSSLYESWGRLLAAAEEGGSLTPKEHSQLKARFEAQPLQCQALLKENFRRCHNQAAPDSIYCAHHKEHGYGID